MVAIKPWGNSQGIRLPKEILEKANISSTDALTIETAPDTIILRKKFRHKTFEERLAEYNGKIDIFGYEWGEPKGREMLSRAKNNLPLVSGEIR